MSVTVPSAVQIVHDVPALLRSTLTTLIAFSVTVAGVCALLVALPGIPASQNTTIAAVGAAAVAFGTACRQAYAWLDKNNASFGRVATVSTVTDDGPPPAGPQDIVTLDDQGQVLGNEGTDPANRA